MFRHEKQKRRCKATIDGEMTIYNAAALKEKIAGILDDPRPLEINLANVTELDSAGVQLLMLARRECARRNRTLTFAAQSDAVLDTIELMGLVDYFREPVVSEDGQGASHGS